MPGFWIFCGFLFLGFSSFPVLQGTFFQVAAAVSYELLEPDFFLGDHTQANFCGVSGQCNTQLVCTAACDRPRGGKEC